MTDYLMNFINGTIAGSTATIVSHPLFVIKNHVQNGHKLEYKSHFNSKWLYSGLFRAMGSYSIEKMIVFGVYNSLRKHDIEPMLAGGISGFFASFTITPGEQLTIDKNLNVSKFSLRHLYQGLHATIFREVLGFAVHFKSYTYFSDKYNKEREPHKTVLCGTAAVISGWGTIVPIDRIKTRIQSGTFNIKTYDFKGSFNGFQYALMRAIPFHVTCFLVMELLSKKD